MTIQQNFRVDEVLNFYVKPLCVSFRHIGSKTVLWKLIQNLLLKMRVQPTDTSSGPARGLCQPTGVSKSSVNHSYEQELPQHRNASKSCINPRTSAKVPST